MINIQQNKLFIIHTTQILKSEIDISNLLLIVLVVMIGLFFTIIKSNSTTKTNPDTPTSDDLPTPIKNRHLELKMLVESTYIGSIESIKNTPNQKLSETHIESIFKRPNVYALHERNQSKKPGEISFNYDNGESIFSRVAQLYLCVNIEINCTDKNYQDILNTKALAVMKRRLQGATFTLRELRYERIGDTDRVISGSDNI